MPKKIFLRDADNEKLLPITRGELVLDSSGNIAFHSDYFTATTERSGLMPKEYVNKVNDIANRFVTTDTPQTITGIKTFANDIFVNNNIVLHSGNYNNYTPTLTGTGATGTWGINISGRANTSLGIYRIDDRNDNTNPYNNATGQVTWHLKTNSEIGLPSDKPYSGVMILSPWDDASGGSEHLLAFHSNGYIYHRWGIDNWSSWKTILDSDNYTSYALPSELVNTEQNANDEWIRLYALNKIRGHVHNMYGLEWQYLFGISSGKKYGSILRTSYGNGTPRMQIMGLYNGTWSNWREVAYDDIVFKRHAWWDSNIGNNVDDLRGGITFVYPSHNAPVAGTVAAFDCYNSTGYTLQILGSYSGENLYFRNRNGDYSTWNAWRYVIHDGNIGSLSVNYATSAGDADTIDGYQASSFMLKSGSYISGTTVADVKANLLNYFKNKPATTNAYTSSTFVNNFGNDSYTIEDSSVCGWIALNPGYDNYNHGHFLVSEYGNNRLRHVGLGYNEWYGPYILAYTSDIPKKLSELENDLGYVTGGPYLPLTGGTISGNLTVSGSNYPFTVLSTNSEKTFVKFITNSGRIGYIGTNGTNPLFTTYDGKAHTIWHTGNLAKPDWDAASNELGYINNRPFHANWTYKVSGISLNANVYKNIASVTNVGVKEYYVAEVEFAGLSNYLYGEFDYTNGSNTHNLVGGGSITFTKEYTTLKIFAGSKVLIKSFKLTNQSGVLKISPIYLDLKTINNQSLFGTGNITIDYNNIAGIPDSLKNPYYLYLQPGTFTSTSYDGSSLVTVNIPTRTSHLLNDMGYLTNASIGNGTITVKQNEKTIGSFTTNQSSNTTIDLVDSVTRIYTGTSGTVSNTNTVNPYLKVTDNNIYRNQIQFKGEGATTVQSDANGVITISSDNTTYTFTNKNATLDWDTTTTIANIGSIDITVKLPKNPNTNTTYSFSGGTNKFTVTPSTGESYDVTITPSITNNITGSGTTGYLAKFNGNNTITNGPALGSNTTTYLRNDGTWGTPPNDNYFHSPYYTSGLYIASGTGVNDMYVPDATAFQSGVVTTATQTFAGQKTFANGIKIGLKSLDHSTNNTRIYFGDGEYVWIGEYDQDDSLTLHCNSSDSIKFQIGSTIEAEISLSGVFSVDGFFETSDERFKNILKPLKVDLDELSKLRKVYYTWKNKESNKIQIGMLAQEVLKIYPELVNIDSSGYLSLAYDKLSVIALDAIQELYTIIKKLQNDNLLLKKKINILNIK